MATELPTITIAELHSSSRRTLTKAWATCRWLRLTAVATIRFRPTRCSTNRATTDAFLLYVRPGRVFAQRDPP